MFVIIADCEIMTAIIHQIRSSQLNPNIIFLDFYVCEPIQREHALHLEIFRLQVLLVSIKPMKLWDFDIVSERSSTDLCPVCPAQTDRIYTLLFSTGRHHEKSLQYHLIVIRYSFKKLRYRFGWYKTSWIAGLVWLLMNAVGIVIGYKAPKSICWTREQKRTTFVDSSTERSFAFLLY